MATNLAIDDKLIEEARKVGGHKTKKAAVIDALVEYIQHKKQINNTKPTRKVWKPTNVQNLINASCNASNTTKKQRHNIQRKSHNIQNRKR